MERSLTIEWVGKSIQKKKEKLAKPQQTIRQIIAAEGWRAVYAIRPETNHHNPV